MRRQGTKSTRLVICLITLVLLEIASTVSFAHADALPSKDPKHKHSAPGGDLSGPWFTYKWSTQGLWLQLRPVQQTGTHINRWGGHLALGFRLGQWSSALDWLMVQLRVQAHGDVTGWGIPGGQLSLEGAAVLGVTLGDEQVQKGLPFLCGHRAWTIMLFYKGLLDTQATSQWTGAFLFSYSHPGFTFRLLLENDALALQGLDQYRTGAAEISLHFGHSPHTWGIGLGVILWTGTTKGLANLDFGQTYNMSGQHGATSSHGVVFLSLYYRFLKLSLGWDAEAIRDTVQYQWIHRLIDDGRIPSVKRPDRIFFQLQINPTSTLY